MMGVNVDGPIGAGVDAGGPAVTVTVEKLGTEGELDEGVPDWDPVAQDVETTIALTVIAQKRSRMGTSNHARTRHGSGWAAAPPAQSPSSRRLGSASIPPRSALASRSIWLSARNRKKNRIQPMTANRIQLINR